MTTGFLIVALLIGLGLIALDRLAVRFVSPAWLSGIELLVVVVAGFSYANANRMLTLDLTNNPSPYFVVIWTEGPPATPVPQTRFGFDKAVSVPTGTVVQLDQQYFPILTVKTPAHWSGQQYSVGVDLTHPRFASAYFYGTDDYQNKRAEVDSLLRQAVARQ